MRLPRPRFTLSTLIGVILLVGLSLGLVQNWRRWVADAPGAGERIASEILAMRDARTNSDARMSGDPALLGGFVVAIFIGSAARREIRKFP